MIKINQYIKFLDYPGYQHPHCNCLLIEDDVRCIIDSSCGEEDLAYLKQRPVDIILHTHGHHDHYFYNHCFPNSTIYMHQADHAIAQSTGSYLHFFGIEPLGKNPQLNSFFLKATQYLTTEIHARIEDKQGLDLGSTRLEMLHLPGHSAGHCGFLFPDQGFVYTGDIDLSVFGPWYGNLNCKVQDFLDSLDRLIALKPDYIITGHGEGIVKEKVIPRLQKFRDIIYYREQRILDLIKSGHHTLEEMAAKCPVYQKIPKPHAIYYIYEQVMILVHLWHLEEQEIIFKEGQGYYLR
jgi:glyoxylase-like metal-dependent hydrolase (beta-lactamase superfamily II)